MCEALLYIPDRVVTKITDQAATEAGQAGVLRSSEARQIVLHVRQWVSDRDARNSISVFDFRAFVAAHFQAAGRREADIRVPPEALTSYDGFEEVRVRLICELQIDGERCVEVGKGLEHERHTVVAVGGKSI